jgi:hypothetical protein
LLTQLGGPQFGTSMWGQSIVGPLLGNPFCETTLGGNLWVNHLGDPIVGHPFQNHP